MKTRMEIATISYNSEEFLKQKLNELIENHTISDYMYICHTAEMDEKKDHIHLWIKPNKTLDTMSLQDHFKEIDMEHPDKPKKCIDFRKSQSDDWVLYCQHYGPYLASKNEAREYCYTKEDFRFADEDTFDDIYYHAFKGSDWARRYELLQLLNDGRISSADLILSGAVPLNYASQLNALDYMKKHQGTLDRGERPNHEQDEDDIEFYRRKRELQKQEDDLMLEKWEHEINELQKKIDKQKKKRDNDSRSGLVG